MKKIIITTIIGIFITSGLLVCKTNKSFRASVIENVEALTNGDNGLGSNVKIETEMVYSWQGEYNYNVQVHPVQGTPFSDKDRSFWANLLSNIIWGVNSGEYWCSEQLATTPTAFRCYEIVVLGN